jgi:hypothetical protein
MKFDLFYDTALQHIIAVADAAFERVPLLERARNRDYLGFLAVTGLAAYSKTAGKRTLIDGYVSMLQTVGVVDEKRENIDADAVFAMADNIMRTIGQFNIFGIVFNSDDLTSLKTVIKEAERAGA